MEISNKIPFSNPKFKNGLEPFQVEILKKVLGSNKKVIMLNAPCASGKSPIAMTASHYFNYPNQSLYLCTTKILQDQISDDFSELYKLKGRGNYPCGLLPSFNADKCYQQCEEYKIGEVDCTYEDAKKEALKSTFTTLNLHYYLTESNYVGKFSNRKTIIIDEADELERMLIDFVAFDILPKTLEKLNLGQPKFVTKLDSWKEWAEQALKTLGEKVVKLKQFEENLDREAKMELNQLLRIHKKLQMLKDNIKEDWIFEHKEKFRFQPLWLTPEITQQYLFKHAERIVMMSATLLPKVIFCRLLGLNVNDVDYGECDSQIPVENRQIIFKPIKKLKYKESEDEVYDEILKTINMNKHKNEKGLIHAGKYDRAVAIATKLGNRCITHNSYNKVEKLKEFYNSKDKIFVSPSSERGLDLVGDLARFIIYPKIPFPNLSDKVVGKRLYTKPFGQWWYQAITAQSVVQGCSRATRNVNDFSVAYIFDSAFDSIIEYTPKWFQKAIKVEF